MMCNLTKHQRHKAHIKTKVCPSSRSLNEPTMQGQAMRKAPDRVTWRTLTPVLQGASRCPPRHKKRMRKTRRHTSLPIPHSHREAGQGSHVRGPLAHAIAKYLQVLMPASLWFTQRSLSRRAWCAKLPPAATQGRLSPSFAAFLPRCVFRPAFSRYATSSRWSSWWQKVQKGLLLQPRSLK